MSRASTDGVEMCRPRRQTAGEEWHDVGALELIDLRISVPLNGARIAYKELDHPPETRFVGDSVLVQGRWCRVARVKTYLGNIEILLWGLDPGFLRPEGSRQNKLILPFSVGSLPIYQHL